MKRSIDSARPIFIVGAPRSGTTLLQYMLRSHPRISVPTGESHFVIPLYRHQNSFGDCSNPGNIAKVLGEMWRINASFVETDLHGVVFDVDSLARELAADNCASVRDVIAGLFAMNARGEGKVRWGDKTPYYVLHIPKLLDWFPDAQIIHLIRDGRDCALSMLERRHDFSVYNVYHAAKYWQQYVEIGRAEGRRLPPRTYLEVRYEDMLESPEAEMRRIVAFLGEEYCDALLNFRKARGGGKTPLLGKPVQRDNRDKWRSTMSSLQVRVFESAAGNTLRENGYALATSGSTLPLPARAMFRLHAHSFALANRHVGKRLRQLSRILHEYSAKSS